MMKKKKKKKKKKKGVFKEINFSKKLMLHLQKK
jgi:hypothetical protein